MTAEQMKERIEAHIPDARAQVQTDGHHYEAVVVSPAFAGLSRVKQHRLVYGCLKEEMKEAVHALALKTYTPEAYAKAGASQ